MPIDLSSTRRLTAVLFLGFASGLPLALTGQAMQAWLTVEGVDIATIGFLGLVGMPYAFKFLWAPLMDRFDIPFLGRRRGWLVVTQVALALMLFTMAGRAPVENPALFALTALFVAFLSASQDVVVDAYRTDILDVRERGLGASFSVFGYRLAMILSGGVALIWAEQWHSWAAVYRVMGGILLSASAVSLFLLPAVPGLPLPGAAVAARPARDPTLPSGARSAPLRELRGFLAMVAGVAAGAWLSRQLLVWSGLDPASPDKWIQFLFVMTGVALALVLGLGAAKKAGFDTLNRSFESYFSMSGARAFLAMIILYKLGDAFAGSLSTPFLIKGVGFTLAEVGIANKIIGIWLTILGALLAGALMLRISLFRALLFFGVLQLVSNFGFYALAVAGKGAIGSFVLPPFDLGFVSLDRPADMDGLLLFAIAIENISSGMGTAAFVALLMSLCHHRYTATHFALLSALAAVGRIFVSPLAGVLSESIGWPLFFLVSVVMAVPGLWMVWWLRRDIGRLTSSLD